MQQTSKIKTLYFVSVIRTPDSDSTSTHLMTEALLKGWRENDIKVTFFAICEHPEEAEKIKNYYSKHAERVIVLKSQYKTTGGKVAGLLNILKATVFQKKYHKEILKKIPEAEKPDLILSHAPSFEAIPFAGALKKIFHKTPFYQYWSDPLALSGIEPEDFGYKRWLFYFAEKKAYKNADQIIFGTKTLLDANSVLYKKHIKKMRYVDVAYLPKEEKVSVSKGSKEFIYAGNYFSEIRNIKPLYNAFNKLGGDYKLYIYGSSNVELENTPNVTTCGRIPSKELESIEASFKNNISILNHSCIQIPGKTFYQTDTDQNILVVADGRHRNKIIEYLNSYERFIVCDNTEEEIIQAIGKIACKERYRCKKDIKIRLSPKTISKDILIDK